jgi:hypothetical protein
MKKIQLLVAFSLPFLFTGCCSLFCNTDVQCPQDDLYRPTFDTSVFSEKQPITYKYWVQELDDKQTLIIQNPDIFYGNMEEVSALRKEYNLLLKSINDFNVKVNELNKKDK